MMNSKQCVRTSIVNLYSLIRLLCAICPPLSGVSGWRYAVLMSNQTLIAYE